MRHDCSAHSNHLLFASGQSAGKLITALIQLREQIEAHLQRFLTRDIMFHKMSFQQWDSVLKVNLYGTYNCCKAVIQGMRDRNYGRIVNLSSVVAYGNAGQVNYSATKGAIISLTKTLAKEGARKNITVNAIAPDCIDTPMMHGVPADFLQDLLNRHPMQRLGKPEEVASLVAFLANEECSYVSGTVIDCSGANRT